MGLNTVTVHHVNVCMWGEGEGAFAGFFICLPVLGIFELLTRRTVDTNCPWTVRFWTKWLVFAFRFFLGGIPTCRTINIIFINCVLSIYRYVGLSLRQTTAMLPRILGLNPTSTPKIPALLRSQHCKSPICPRGQSLQTCTTRPTKQKRKLKLQCPMKTLIKVFKTKTICHLFAVAQGFWFSAVPWG